MVPYRYLVRKYSYALIFANTVTNPLTVGIHLNHGTSIDDLKITGYSYSVK